MKITAIPEVKSDERGVIYNCDKVGFIIRKEGSISANHSHPQEEILYLVRGKIELTIGDIVQEVSAPAKIEIEGNTYHKLVALTEIMIVEDKVGFEK